MRRALLLWLVLFAAYAATLGLDASGESDYAGSEPHHLLAAESLVEDGGLDVADEYAARAWDDFYPYDLHRTGVETGGRLHEPLGVGFPLLIAPAYALGGAQGVELLAAALAALACALGYALAVRAVPDPWASGAALAIGLSPPFLAHGTAVGPELTAAAAIAGAALLAARLTESVSRRDAFLCAALVGVLPWLGVRFAPAGIVVGAFAMRSLLRAGRRTLALGSAELALFSAALCVGINEALYGGPTPYAAALGDGGTGAGSAAGYLERASRLVGLLLDREVGLLRWAPFLVLAVAGTWLLHRSRRDRLSKAIPALRAAERIALMCVAVLGVQLLVAAFLAPSLFGPWSPARHLIAALPMAMPLAAWGLRRLPRGGGALAALTVAASVWLYLEVSLGDSGFVTPLPAAPWGPLEAAFPSFR